MNKVKIFLRVISITIVIYTILVISPSSKAATPASFDWGSIDLAVSGSTAFGVYDTDNTTILQTGDLAQLIWVGPNGTIDAPQSDGSPGGDDVLLDTTTVENTGSLPPPSRNKGYIPLKTYSFDTDDTENGGTIYIRAWSDSTPINNVSSYGNSGTSTLSGGGSFNAARWNTETALAATLATFTATSQPDHVLVDWATVAEQDNLGFNLLRSTSAEGEQVAINPELIPSQAPGSGQGASYSFEDSDVVDGTTYYYWLQDVDTSGTAGLHGPVSVTYESNPTAVDVSRLGALSDSRWGEPWVNGLLGTLLLAAGAAWSRRFSGSIKNN